MSFELMLSRYQTYKDMREKATFEPYIRQLRDTLKRHERVLQLAKERHESMDVLDHAKGQKSLAKLRIDLTQPTTHEAFINTEREIERVNRINWEDDRHVRQRWFELLEVAKAEEAAAVAAGVTATSSATVTSSFGASRRIISKNLFVQRYRLQRGCSKKEAEKKYDQVMKLIFK